jgi:cytochrome c oxidase subunit 1
MIALGFFYSAYYFIQALRKGEKALDNPWNALTLEWQTSSPPPHDNFVTTPVVTDWPYEYLPENTSMPVNLGLTQS